MRISIAVIDSLSEWSGKVFRWLCVALVLIMSYEVMMRYVFNAPSFWSYEVSTMLGATIYAMSWSYVHKHHSHVRVDVFYSHLPFRGKALIDVLGDMLAFFPVVIIWAITSFNWTLQSWAEGEVSSKTGWYPPMAPVRAMVFIGLILFGLQGVAEFLRNIYALTRNKLYD